MKSYVCATLPATLSIIEMINTNLRCGLYFYVLIGGMHIILFVKKIHIQRDYLTTSLLKVDIIIFF